MTFIQGEKKEVRIEVTSTSGDPFVIRNAKYELVRSGEIVASGEALVEEHEVYALIEPSGKGIYRLLFTYEIAAERLKTPISITVT